MIIGTCNSGSGLKGSDIQISQARDQDPNHMIFSCNKIMHESYSTAFAVMYRKIAPYSGLRATSASNAAS